MGSIRRHISAIELFCKVTTKMADQDVKDSHEKTVILETFGGGTKINVLFY